MGAFTVTANYYRSFGILLGRLKTPSEARQTATLHDQAEPLDYMGLSISSGTFANRYIEGKLDSDAKESNYRPTEQTFHTGSCLSTTPCENQLALLRHNGLSPGMMVRQEKFHFLRILLP